VLESFFSLNKKLELEIRSPHLQPGVLDILYCGFLSKFGTFLNYIHALCAHVDSRDKPDYSYFRNLLGNLFVYNSYYMATSIGLSRVVCKRMVALAEGEGCPGWWGPPTHRPRISCRYRLMSSIIPTQVRHSRKQPWA
jgi:hypothetical protein